MKEKEKEDKHSPVLSPALCPRKVAAHCPVSADHTLSCMSALPLRTTTPDGKKRHTVTSPTWPLNVLCRKQRTVKMYRNYSHKANLLLLLYKHRF